MRANYKVMFTKLNNMPAKGEKAPYTMLTGVFADSGKSKDFYVKENYNHLVPWKFYNFDIDITFGEGGKSYVNLMGVSDIPVVK